MGGKNIVTADCDVDAADMHLLLEPDFSVTEDFYSGELAVIDQETCISCGKCADVCRYDAVQVVDDRYSIDPLNCEGCGYCARICPAEAIVNEEQNVGDYYISTTKVGSTMVHARLHIGAENSGKLVAKVKNEAKRIAKETGKELVLVDGSPGTGCPVISSLSGADFVLLVTEPTVSGLHDLKRVYQLVKKFNIEAGCIINKADLNLEVTGEIEDFLKEERIAHIANLPYDETFTKAMTAGQTIVEYKNSSLKEMLKKSWDNTLQIINKEK